MDVVDKQEVVAPAESVVASEIKSDTPIVDKQSYESVMLEEYKKLAAQQEEPSTTTQSATPKVEAVVGQPVARDEDGEIERPIGWDNEHFALLKKLDSGPLTKEEARELRAYTTQRTREPVQYAQALTREVAEERRRLEPLMREYESNKDLFASQGIDPALAMRQAVAWHKQLEADPYQALLELAQWKKITPEQFASALKQVQPEDPRDAKIAELEARFTQREQAEVSAREQHIRHSIINETEQEFSDTAKYPLIQQIGKSEVLGSRLASATAAIREVNPQMSNKEVLSLAYTALVNSDPELLRATDQVRKQAEETQKLEEGAKRVAQASRAATASIQSSPAISPMSNQEEARPKRPYTRAEIRQLHEATMLDEYKRMQGA